MNYFLDTNICIYYLKGLYPALVDRFYQHSVSEIKIASIVKAELLFGAKKSKKQEDNTKKVEQFLLPFEIVSFDDRAAVRYAEIRAEMAFAGTPIGPNDLIIAATVITNNGTLITNNENEFSRVEGLLIENWVAGSRPG
jgi:tRNA(fMet)-specific endonuclease VapC